MKKEPLPDFMQRTQGLIQSQLRDMHWQVQPVVVLMPAPRIWVDDNKAEGQHS